MNLYVNDRDRPKRKRISGPKVRTGCLTCKQRRIKCDEEKPNCNRCSRGLKKCTWKDNFAVFVETPRPKTKILLPKQFDDIIFQPSIQMFTNDKELWCFRVYSTETHQQLSGAYRSHFWSQIVLQAAVHHPFIKNAIVAIGSFAWQAKALAQLPSKGTDQHEKLSSEEEFALSHYQKFLSGSRKVLYNADDTTRMALITCLLVICIENQQWHHATSLNAVWGGTKLLNAWLTSQGQKGKRVSCVRSPDPLAVEDAIVQQLKLVETQTAWLCDEKPAPRHEKLCRAGHETIEGMAELFSSVDEARLVLDLIGRRIHHFIGWVRPEVLGSTDFSPPGQQRSFRIKSDGEEPYAPLTAAQLLLRQSYSEEIERWTKSYAKLSRSITPDSPDFIAHNIMRIHAAFYPILLFGKTSTSEMIYDEYLPNFHSMIKFAKIHFAHPSVQYRDKRGVNSLNNGLVFPLHTLVRRCRDRKTRREGIELLVGNDWREGIHFSNTSGRMGAYFMEIEEKDVQSDMVIPEKDRLVMFEMTYIESEDRRIACVKTVKGGSEGRETLKERWEWGLDDDPMVEYSTSVEGGGEDNLGNSNQTRLQLGMAMIPKDWQTRP